MLDFGSFECTAAKTGDGKPVWTCPAQTFTAQFKEPPVVFLSIAGFSRLAVVDGSLSIEVDAKDQPTKEGFQPMVEDLADKPTAQDKSEVRVSWIAIGDGERGKKARSRKEERRKLR